MSAATHESTASTRQRRPVAPLTSHSLLEGVVGRFRTVVEAQPDEAAVVDGRETLTFAEVAAEAGRVLALLRSAAPATTADGSPAPVALLHSHDAGAVAALLAVIASGHPVVVLDPRTPPARLAMLLERIDVRHCLTDAALAGTAHDLVPHVVEVGAGPAAGAATTGLLWSSAPDPDQIAVLAFTSGSTGRPKVVANDHRMLVRDAWINSAASGSYDADDVMAHTLPMGFHAGLMATVAGLLVGCTMTLYDIRGNGIGGLAGWLDREGATVMYTSPAIARALVATRPDPKLLGRVRSLSIAGEAAYGSDVEALRAVLPTGCVIRNRYGSSETGTVSEFAITADLPLTDAVLPTGHAIGDSVLAVVDTDGRPVPPGEAGVVTVTSPRPALGYWGDPAATAAAFTTNPDGTRTYTSSDVGRFDPAGRLELLGRRDHSVKIRGYLVEPGEVDAALHALPEVREAVTIGATRPADGLHRLVSYVVPASERPSGAEIRSALHRTLPGHMVPETVVFVTALPRTDRGKLDRSALPEPPAVTAGARVDELSEWESVVAAVWERVLGLDVVGPDDDFFELGGDSLAAERLMAALVADAGVPEAEARTALLAEASTLAAFSRRLRRRPGKGLDTLIPLQTHGSRPPLFVVAGAGGLGVGLVPLARHLGPDQPVYALQAHALERRGIPDWSVRAAAKRHVRAIRGVQPHGPYRLGGHSFGGVVALEVAHQLRAAGEQVALLAVLDSFPPDPDAVPRRPALGPVRRLRDLAGLLATGVVATPGLGQFWRFHRQSMVLARRYRCTPWPGRTLVVVAQSPDRVARSAWAPHLSGSWSTLTIEGDHLSMMREPYAGQIATAVAAELERAAGPI